MPRQPSGRRPELPGCRTPWTSCTDKQTTQGSSELGLDTPLEVGPPKTMYLPLLSYSR